MYSESKIFLIELDYLASKNEITNSESANDHYELIQFDYLYK
ncbi:hypothetical protein P278_06530 [Zhouia amylolytica AD3]|uniref:Uncharacterized protein n=1 Tax=Zhouia amylolytica AD3 TaxID=1286632 RepID=W2USZ1_9FLAO|nr:hypothetical protein P278_06530 [Zhouia amylolytica AD3]